MCRQIPKSSAGCDRVPGISGGAPRSSETSRYAVPAPKPASRSPWRGVTERLQEEYRAGSIDTSTLLESEAFKTVLVQAMFLEFVGPCEGNSG